MSRVALSRFAVLLALATSVSAAPLIVGHRGTGSDASHNKYRENSLESIQAAFDEGADLVEIDVQVAKDGTVVLWHDEKISVRGERKGVHELNPVELPNFPDSLGKSVPIPTFREALRLALGQGRRPKVLDIEIKVVAPALRNQLCSEVARVLTEERATRRIMVSSFDAEALKLLEAELPGLESGLLGFWRRSTLKKGRRLLAKGVPIEWIIPSNRSPFGLATSFHGGPSERAAFAAKTSEDLEVGDPSKFVVKARAAGLKVGIWTVNRAKGIQRFSAYGFGLLITDEPDLARETLHSVSAD